MAQRDMPSAGARIARRLAHARRRGAVAACIAAAVLAVIAVTAAGAFLAGGESFELPRRAAAPGEASEAARAPEADGGEEERARAPEAAPVVVDVGGAVQAPGVYELTDGARVADAVAAAGGLSADADTSSLNQAALLADGEKVYVPRAGEAPVTLAPDAAAAPATGAAGAPGGLVDINRATLAELDELPGIGPATAQAIVDDREENGPFASPEDLMRVSGIGEKKFEKLAGLICA